MVFDKQTIVEKYENQFKVKDMKNKHIFHDIYTRVGDPEELRGFIVELLQDSDWKTSINELTKFEDEEMEPIFRGGRLKPIRSIIKAFKQIKKGPKYPWVWKLFFLIGAGFLGLYLYALMVPNNWNMNLILEVTPVWFILALIVYSIKETVSLAMWVKISGVYDINDGNADVRIVLAADADKKDKEAFDKLEEDMSEIYSVLNRKYVPRKKPTKTEIVKVLKPKKKQPELSLMKTMKDIDQQIATLNKRFINKEISEETYKELKNELEKRKTKAETVLDLLSI